MTASNSRSRNSARSVKECTPHPLRTRSAEASLDTSTAASSAPAVASASRCTWAQRPPPIKPNLMGAASRALSPERLRRYGRHVLDLLLQVDGALLGHRLQHGQGDPQGVYAVIYAGHLSGGALGEFAVELLDLRPPSVELGCLPRLGCAGAVERHAGVPVHHQKAVRTHVAVALLVLHPAGQAPRDLHLAHPAAGVGEGEERAVQRLLLDAGQFGATLAEGVAVRLHALGLAAEDDAPEVEEVAAHVYDRATVAPRIVHQALGPQAGHDGGLRQHRAA